MPLSPESTESIQQSAFYTPLPFVKEALNKSILLMVRQAHHERNQMLTVLPNLSKDLISDSLSGSCLFRQRNIASCWPQHRVMKNWPPCSADPKHRLIGWTRTTPFWKLWHPYPCQPIYQRTRLSTATGPSKKGMMEWYPIKVRILTKRFPIWKCVGDPVRINLKPLRKSGAHCWNISPR